MWVCLPACTGASCCQVPEECAVRPPPVPGTDPTHHCTTGVGKPCTVKQSFTDIFSQTVWDLRRTRISGALLMRSSLNEYLSQASLSATCPGSKDESARGTGHASRASKAPALGPRRANPHAPCRLSWRQEALLPCAGQRACPAGPGRGSAPGARPPPAAPARGGNAAAWLPRTKPPRTGTCSGESGTVLEADTLEG